MDNQIKQSIPNLLKNGHYSGQEILKAMIREFYEKVSENKIANILAALQLRGEIKAIDTIFTKNIKGEIMEDLNTEIEEKKLQIEDAINQLISTIRFHVDDEYKKKQLIFSKHNMLENLNELITKCRSYIIK